VAVRTVTVKLPESLLDAIDELVRQGKYMNRSDVIRHAVRRLLEEELWGNSNYSNSSARPKKRSGVVVKVIE
jgi:Predicted transcriptional regulators containing the CopG/Arc/MetJ DNA-binding domain and a metal-binding domain